MNLDVKFLSTIFGKEVDFVGYTVITKETGSTVSVRFKEGNYYDVPLTYLAHKCKEWAFNLDENVIQSGTVESGTGYAEVYSRYRTADSEPDKVFGSSNDTETEAIFKACKWIMNKKKG